MSFFIALKNRLKWRLWCNVGITRVPDGKDHKITIPDYKDGITNAEIKTGAQAIVDQGAFEPDGFALAKVVGAVRVDTTKTDVAVE